MDNTHPSEGVHIEPLRALLQNEDAFTADDIQADFQRFMEEQGPEATTPLLIVDYLQILPQAANVLISDARQAVDYIYGK